ncbi:SMI1/KNR4 family protein [Acidovorax sp.]|uniref:SMI1/KNR4 family protein n=1 Tax=Acidovorax sp. TaxID=1872122 RepID=UPI002ACD74D5|nr:SMI1/KNR4 family protein [Acidovorax sp.]MDZ7867072.1 SMI1/KNR4 family protein [Acidovorax sp.]
MSALLQALDALAADTGIALPPLLRHLVAGGATAYGPDWAATWRERCLSAPPPLISCGDFEWLDAQGVRTTAEEWLNPAYQNGQRLVPFAETGAGDAWCLLPLEGSPEPGVALVRHDSGASEVGYRSFQDFACVQLLRALADLSDWTGEDGFTTAQACQVVRNDVDQVAAGMHAATGAWLRALSRAQPLLREVRDGPRCPPRTVPSLVSQSALLEALERFSPPDVALAITARWECAPAMARSTALLAAKAPPDWRALARNPGSKLAALRAHQQAHGSTLQQAKAAVDDFIQNSTGQNP